MRQFIATAYGVTEYIPPSVINARVLAYLVQGQGNLTYSRTGSKLLKYQTERQRWKSFSSDSRH